jgi:hypothetical protein
MNTRVPWWTLLIALLIGSAATYAWATRQREGTIEEIRAQADSVMAAVKAVRTLAEDSIDVLEDSLSRMEVRIDTIEAVREEASGAVEVSGSNLQQHLDLREDSAGLRLWTEHELADQHLASLWQEERNIWQRQIEMRVEMEMQLRNIIASQDTELVALRGSFRAMQAEAERWRLKAEPPWAIRFFRDGLECGAGGAAAYGLSNEPVVGFGAAGACLLVKQILP